MKQRTPYVYFCYFVMESGKFEMTLVRQLPIYSTSANLSTLKLSQNVVLGLNINIRQKSKKTNF